MKRILHTLLGAAAGVVLVGGALYAQLPQQISYQGLVTNAAGQAVSDGPYSMTFRLYEQPTGGTAIWTESQSSVQISRGLFNVILGRINPFQLPFDKQYWIGTTIGSNNEISPRIALTAAPYSFRSLTADSAYAVPVNAIGTENIRNGAVSLSKIDATGSQPGQVLMSNGTNVTWAAPGNGSGTGVTSINGVTGAIQLNTSGGIILNRSGDTFTLKGPTGISSINSADNAIGVTNGTGPAVSLTLQPESLYDFYLLNSGISGIKLKDSTITGSKLASGSVTASQLSDNSVTSSKVVDGSIQNIDLANPYITINPGIGISGGGTVPLGGSVTVNNAGVLSVAGTANQVNVSSATGAVTLSLPQNIATTSSPTFNSLTLTGKATSASTALGDPGNTLVTKDYLTTLSTLPASADATLVGDGTVPNPLGINLAHPNTWTATQTLPTTAGQGDALIASTNAGSTTIIDARVADNLTINGGTINNTPIGAATPSTGAFTSISGTGLALSGKGTSASTVAADPGSTLVTKDFVTNPGNVAVSTNATITGNGTTATPLGVNLANPNTWTGTQTLPVTGVQGDALIASTNAGTTTINAPRIGNGLTDAQVNDNLTINGGTVNNTPIGATTPSTGAFTTINGTSLALTAKGTSASTVAADPGNTLVTKDFVTTPGNVSVSTNVTMTGNGTTGSPLGVNLANANTWTGTQTLPTTAAQGDALIASTNNGTTTIVDARVADNLTINGGTVNNTPIGATTPSTGAFTTINGTSLALTAKGTSASTLPADPGNTLVTKDFVTAPGNVAVSTNATITGDGTTGNPLGVNLANPNTWTGTQTLPTTAAQGDALIASTNNGTTTINAPRIGNGLTDAQVNDNLTINGGTVDNTPIGATTPSTGTFTTINGASLSLTAKGTSASTVPADPGNTLVTKDFVTTAGNVAVSTDATLTGNGTVGSPLGFNLANANTWTATQAFPATGAQGDALITSTNAATTTINAPRIGNGLTDAQVNDNLTINGGTVDATPIGATTPSTGAFTTINGASLSLTAKGTSASTVAADPGNTLVTKDFVTAPGNVAVSTNGTLTGDGTIGNPLGVNLANANTWTGTQTLPTTAAQGDAVINSANAGTTTINAPRIGNGLTDAQVNDNLTINGGTVDNTPIGATTPNTGAFTSVSITGKATSASTVAADPGNTLVTKDFVTAAGNVAVSTNTTMTGDGTTGNPLGVNLANPNTWTGDQTLPTTAAQGDALIASTNAGTTTINDARVADNLTVNGGTVDNTPIGATTPSTGAFTTINGASLSLTAKGTSASTVAADPGNTLVTKDFVTAAGNVAVSTNTTMTGDGTTGNPLGVNLANPNTWTGEQTLPVNATQGDALIASTNAGTTTVNAARIGNGLTDAQVNDNLTVNGGTVDATPIGATTPSTGAFTTIDGTSLALTAKATSASTVVADPGNTLVTKDFVTAAGNVAISTDATLTGNGTSGSPLGFNLSNPNTWTGEQTLPVNATQGDALIASTNAGTTTVNAARIGNGLTDAQVNDNLTINGGTVDATPIGATTPSTGAFTTINGASLALTAKGTSASTVAADPGNTLVTKDFVTAAGNVAISTDATLTGNGTSGSPLGFNLSNPNTWTGEQTLPVNATQGDALIASTNAGTTTVNAARIGNGLTDAQVNDNLTINGGTVDATPIGATTPSTGAFTTIDGASLALTAKGTSASTIAAD
ncbi:MAG: hypothetical protein JST22_20255, partial [Bacteroidetes bacterium]|nr:hypothetical protein [Bacteroidota bacterium]